MTKRKMTKKKINKEKEYDSIEYFLFEQSHDYQHIEESPMEDLQEVVNG